MSFAKEHESFLTSSANPAHGELTRNTLSPRARNRLFEHVTLNLDWIGFLSKKLYVITIIFNISITN